MSLSEYLRLWGHNHPFVAPSLVLGSIIVAGLFWVLKNEDGADYSDYLGTVCCLSDSYYAGNDRVQAYRMMIVDLDNGRRVEVPIRYGKYFVPYQAKERILIRQVSEKIGPHPRYMAIRYVGDGDS